MTAEGRWARGLAGLHLWLSVLLVAGLGWFELSSVDLGYHIAYGRELLRSGCIVTVDPFIYGATNHAFINANWLSQPLFAWLFDRFDAAGLMALRSLLIAAIFLCMWRLLRNAGVKLPGCAWGLMLAALATYERFTLRPELFSYALLAFQLWLLYRPRPVRGLMAWLAISQILWANLHSYFLLGPLLSAARVLQAIVARTLPGRGRGEEAEPGDRRAGDVRYWAVALAVMCAACLVNPWGWRGAIFPIETLDYLRAERIMGQNPEDPVESPWGILSEFQSPFGFIAFRGAYRTIYAYLVLLILSAPAVILAALRRRWDVLATLLLFAAVSTQMRRNIAPFAIVAAPLIVIEFAAVIRAGGPRLRALSFLGRRARLAASLATCGLLLHWLTGIWSGGFYFEERRPARRLAAGFSDHIFPMNAVRWLNEHPDVRPRLFTDLMTSSNVLPWLRPEFKVYITTNTFAYSPAALMRCWNLGLAREDAGTFCAEFDVNAMLLRVHDPTLPLIRRLSRDADWALTYYDANFVIFLRRIPVHAELIRRDERRAADYEAASALRTAERPHVNAAFQIGIAVGVPIALGWFEQAEPLIREALRREPRYVEMWNNLGLCHASAGQQALARREWGAALAEFRQARECFQTVLTLEPGHREARYNLDHTPVRIEGISDGSP